MILNQPRPPTCRFNSIFDVQLIDWGQAAVLLTGPKQLQSWAYNPHHPPERVLQLPAGYPMDVWGAAFVAMHMLTGQVYFEQVFLKKRTMVIRECVCAGRRVFPKAILSEKSLVAYIDKLELLAGCIPSDLLPPDWKHTSEEELQVELTVRDRCEAPVSQSPSGSLPYQ